MSRATALYLVRDNDRTVALAAEHNGKLYTYVPNIDAFIYRQERVLTNTCHGRIRH